MPEGGDGALEENNELLGKKTDIFNRSEVETKEITAEPRSNAWESPHVRRVKNRNTAPPIS